MEEELPEEEFCWTMELEEDEAEEEEEVTPLSEKERFSEPPGVLVVWTMLLPGAVRVTLRLPESAPLLRISQSSFCPSGRS